MDQSRTLFIIPLLIASGFIALYWLISPPDLSKQDRASFLILFAADNLVTNNVFRGNDLAGKQSVPDRHISPALPFIIAGYAKLDSHFKEALSCLVKQKELCQDKSALNHFLIIQYLFIIMGAMAGFYLSYLLSGSWHAALMTMVLLLLAGFFIKFGKILRPMVYQYFIVFTFLIFMGLMQSKKKLVYAFLAGVFLGLSALFQSHFLYAVPFIVIFIFFVMLKDCKVLFYPSVLYAGAVLLGVILTAGLWSYRNYLLFSDFWLCPHEAAQLLAERLTYNRLKTEEVALAAAYWLPSYLSELSSFFLLDQELKQKLGPYIPTSLIYQSRYIMGGLRQEGLNEGQWFPFLLNRHVFTDIGHHLWVSVAIFIRGLWPGQGLAALVGVFFLPRVFKINALLKNEISLRLIFGTFLIFALVFCLFTSGLLWVNLPIIFVYCYAISYVSGSW